MHDARPILRNDRCKVFNGMAGLLWCDKTFELAREREMSNRLADRHTRSTDLTTRRSAFWQRCLARCRPVAAYRACARIPVPP